MSTDKDRIIDQAFSVYYYWSRFGQNHEQTAMHLNGLFELLSQHDEKRAMRVFGEGVKDAQEDLRRERT